jgi:hypothetical protein
MFIPNEPFSYVNILPATFSSQINGVECQLELHLAQGRLMGSFHADGERLEVEGGFPNVYGEVFGQMFSYLEEPIAVFQANPLGANTLELHLDLPNPHDLMALENAERMVFTLVPADQRVPLVARGNSVYERLARAVANLEVMG